MKKIVVDAYKLERISSRMAKEFGTIPKGQEELHALMLHPMESNLLKLTGKIETVMDGMRLKPFK